MPDHYDEKITKKIDEVTDQNLKKEKSLVLSF